MPRSLALGLTGALLAVCGCGDSSRPHRTPPSVSAYLRPPPPGYRYAPATDPAGERQFRAKVKRDFDAEEVQLRNVYRGRRLAAGIVAVRVKRMPSIAAIASRVTPGNHRTIPFTLRGRHVHLVLKIGYPDSQFYIVDTFDHVVLVVSSDRYPVAERIAKPLVR
jgi:hypothetical protein